ncbi:MAG TPA: hypothetical protein VI749_05850 [Candidatus Omnitrophota bacterium]|nr:hypothetical protein [Candidatus Omnitrophota bacterium]
MKRVLMIGLVFFLTACVTTKKIDPIEEAFKTVVYEDGITTDEAIIIAKKIVKEKTPPKSYNLEEPLLLTEFENVPRHEDYWFVGFHEMPKGMFPVVFLVSLNKQTGKIVFSRSYNMENEWVLQATFLKLYERNK